MVKKYSGKRHEKVYFGLLHVVLFSVDDYWAA